MNFTDLLHIDKMHPRSITKDSKDLKKYNRSILITYHDGVHIAIQYNKDHMGIHSYCAVQGTIQMKYVFDGNRQIINPNYVGIEVTLSYDDKHKLKSILQWVHLSTLSIINIHYDQGEKEYAKMSEISKLITDKIKEQYQGGDNDK